MSRTTNTTAPLHRAEQLETVIREAVNLMERGLVQQAADLLRVHVACSPRLDLSRAKTYYRGAPK